jgi:hypothetical protein
MEKPNKNLFWTPNHASKSNKLQKTSAIVFCLILILVASLPAITSASQFQFFPYLTVNPNPIGVNQQATVIFGFTMPTRVPSYYSGWTLSITQPDGTIVTKGPFTSDSTGGTNAYFTPDKTGKYTFQAKYPGGNVNLTGADNYAVPAATTPAYMLTVQESPIPVWQSTPLPTDYWQYPIYGENREWAQIAGDWLMPGYDTARSFDAGGTSGSFNPYTTAPNSSHILWTKPTLFGGIIGGTLGTPTYYTGSAYRRELLPPVIMQGKLYYNVIEPPAYGFYCVDLYTGQTQWFQNQTFVSGTGTIVQGTSAQLSNGQNLIWNTVNQNGAFSFLWSMSGTTWARYDAWTGNLLNTIVNCTTGTQFFGKNGEILQYNIDVNTKTIQFWNSSKAVSGTYNQVAAYNVKWSNGVEWNMSAPDLKTGFSVSIWDPKDPTIIVLTNQTRGNPLSVNAFVDMAFEVGSVKKDANGNFPTSLQARWVQTRDEGTWESVTGNRAMGDNTYTIFRKETKQVYAFSALTGTQLWVTEPREGFWGTYYTGSCFAYGKVYVTAYDGCCYAYDAKNGKFIWKFDCNTVNPSNAETPYNTYPLYGGIVVADGKVFLCNGEHSANSPLYRGESTYAVDASTGKLVWTIDGWYQQLTIANGIIVGPNGYDGQIYCFGKGPTKTTVQAPMTQTEKGHSVMIIGTILDQSPGQKDTPAVSEANMSTWMGYLHMQKPMPKDVQGVPMLLTAIDPNGNSQIIGTATSDIGGSFGIEWTPPVEGKYQITATYEGSNSYGSSYATTYMSVGAIEATPAPTSTPTVAPTIPPTIAPTATASPSPVPNTGLAIGTEVYLGVTAVVVFAAVAATALFLRKRK